MKKQTFILTPVMLAYVAFVIIGCSISTEVEATSVISDSPPTDEAFKLPENATPPLSVTSEPPDNSSGLTPDMAPEYISISGKRIKTTETELSIIIDEEEKTITETGRLIHACSKTVNDEIAQLRYMTNLRVLNIVNYEDAGSSFNDISALEGLTNLTELNLVGNSISDITPLSALTNLTYLCLNNNQIIDVAPLSGLTNLESLWLGSNQISDTTPLFGLTSLRILVLDANQISDTAPLSNLTSLVYLSMDANQISDITPLSGLVNLESLILNNNQISDLLPLSGLICLTDLGLTNNPVTDWTSVENVENVWGRP